MTEKIGVLTSGGDAQGMNAAVRSVVRSALKAGAVPYAIMEGWQGAIDGGTAIKEMSWGDVSSILNKGGTVIGTARSRDFRERSGMKIAALHLLEAGIDKMIIIGGDGSLSGADEFRALWPQFVQELQAEGKISAEVAQQHGELAIAGIVGSIDNDLVGSDMTVGTDSALHRILTAIDELSSTAASHQRTFVVEVMGRHCGYLPLMAAVAGGCDYVFIPELPPADGWEADLAETLRIGREAGRRESIVLVAEGAVDRHGEKIDAMRVAEALKGLTEEDPKVTILGHVQRGGTPSAYDRWMPTVLGFAAVNEVLSQNDDPVILGVHHNRLTRLPLVPTIANTRKVGELIAEGKYKEAVLSRGDSFARMIRINEVLSTPPGDTQNTRFGVPELTGGDLDRLPSCDPEQLAGRRVGIIHIGGLAPGMNVAARAAVRAGISMGFTMLGIGDSFDGLIDGEVRELGWEDVEGWGFSGGAELGTRREIPDVKDYYAIGRAIENSRIDALMIIGGINGYIAMKEMVASRDRYPAFNIPILCVPASIDNNMPGAELSIGADSALNNAVWALDRIKESAAASQRCFVADAMGRNCGYLAFMSGLAAGAERVYLDEDDNRLEVIYQDAKQMRAAFEKGRRLFLVVRNENAGGLYDREFMARVFEQEGEDVYDVRHSALGHLQQGGAPSPYDRILATRLVFDGIEELARQVATGSADAKFIGLTSNGIECQDVSAMDAQMDWQVRRPRDQWWMELQPLIPVVSLAEDTTDVTALDIID